MGSKRKSTETEGGKKVSISVDSSKAAIKPVVATFTAAIPPVASSFATYKCLDKSKSDNHMVVSETEKIEFVGQNFENDKPLFTGCKYLVGVYDKATDTVTFHQAPYVRINSMIKSLRSSAGVPDRDISRNVLGARNELGEAFGNKKRKAQIRAEERNKINMETVKSDMDVIETSIGLRTSSMPTNKDLQKVADDSRPVPKYNPEATNPADIYDMEDVLAKASAAHINIMPFIKASDMEECKKNIPVRSMFVLKKVEQIIDQNKPDLTALRRVLYLAYLLRFSSIKNSALQKREVCIEALQCSPEVADVIYEKFTECVAGSINPDGTPMYTKTPATESKLICHIAVLMLSANSWVLYPAEMAADLGIAGKKAEKYLESVGCKLESASSDEIAAHVLNKRARSGPSKKAVLKAPIKFPKTSAFRSR
ncbi:DNA-directed RNA polymerase I subunit rpa49 [Coemansia spiralis]|uniref:DNA-directed RNA polymerase I subunit rpa49 n=2 Tax=Coemansia TaxID=4863 RepID=A0A9W8G4H3_9FUNG|nr:DNA-directed RNA polymerase I subunit rpa49 [Coemansia umbellata]KAJ2619267.1 DNA-directed RNA polymerase I subunit rpa49 [Coemansia sp. RSA 1358]KAJ2674164.1 DNA-directed RNA polymerase I subunit rpa49 [Coemansia spiralis]